MLAPPPTVTTSAPTPETVSLLLADARLPSGGHVSSSGVEPALMAGMPRTQIAGYMLSRARTTAVIDAATAVVARHLLLNQESADSEDGESPEQRLEALLGFWAARTPSAAARGVAQDLGRGLLRLAVSLWPQVRVLETLGPKPPRPLVMGALAAHTGMDPTSLVRLVIYDDAAAAAAALLKLDPGDPAEAMALVLRACGHVEPHVARLAALTHPADIPAANAPQSEDWIERHALTPRRLFRA